MTGGPKTLASFILMIITGMIKNIKGMLKSTIIGIIVSFVVVLILHTILMLINPAGGANQGSTDLLNYILATTGQQNTPSVLLFWLLFTGIIAFFYSQIRSSGWQKTRQKIVSLPAWIQISLKTAGISAIPLVMGGVAVALLVRLLFLNTLTSIQFLIIMLGILISQQESLGILAMRLGYSDLRRTLTKKGPEIPDPGFPVSGIVGAAAGFFIVLFIPAIFLFFVAAAIIACAGVLFVVSQKRRTLPVKVGLILLVVCVLFALVTVPVRADQSTTTGVKYLLRSSSIFNVHADQPTSTWNTPLMVAETMNVDGVGNGATSDPQFTFSSPVTIVSMYDYHWNNAKGRTPGTITLQNVNTNAIYGPFSTYGIPGMGGVPNAIWETEPGITLPGGTYRVEDSNTATWSQNSDTGGAGMTHIVYQEQTSGVTPVSASEGGQGAVSIPAAVASSTAPATVGAAGGLIGGALGGLSTLPFGGVPPTGGTDTPPPDDGTDGMDDSSVSGGSDSSGSDDGSDSSDSTDSSGSSDSTGSTGTIYGDGSVLNPFTNIPPQSDTPPLPPDAPVTPPPPTLPEQPPTPPAPPDDSGPAFTYWDHNTGTWVAATKTESETNQNAINAAWNVKAQHDSMVEQATVIQEINEIKTKEAIKEKQITNLEHIQEQMTFGDHSSDFTKDQYETINKNINAVIDGDGDGGVVNKSYNKITKIYSEVYNDNVTGKIIPESSIPTDNQILADTVIGGVEGTTKEVLTGVDSDGHLSFKGLVVRAGLAYLTAGESNTLGGLITSATDGVIKSGSEAILTPLTSLYTMQDYVKKGGDSVLGGFGHAMVDVGVGELIGRGVGGVTTYGGKIVSSVVNELPTSISKPVQNGITKLSNVLNTDVKDINKISFASGDTQGVTNLTTAAGKIPDLDVTVPVNKTRLWQGEEGMKMAQQSGGVLLNETPSGKLIDQTFAANKDIPWSIQKEPWNKASAVYATNAKGVVEVYLTDGIVPGKTFSKIELPILLKNPDVTHIKTFVKENGNWVEKLWFKPRG